MSDAQILRLGEERTIELLKNRFRLYNNYPGKYYFRCEDIYRLLGEGVEVNADIIPDCSNGVSLTAYDPKGWPNRRADKKGLLIAIRSIVPETREQKLEALVRELVEREKTTQNENPRYKINTWLERAKEILK